MTNINFLAKRYLEINKLKTMLRSYPKEYRNTIISLINDVCTEITDYLADVREKAYLDSIYSRAYMEKQVGRKIYEQNRSIEEITEEQRLNLTIEELAKYTGANGSEAYVAINGVIYDVTEANDWNGGRHYGINAGKDLTSYFNTCHQAQEKYINMLTVVGKLINN